MTESLAVRYRPRRFADVAGQAHVCAVLQAAAAHQRPPQQILLAGPSGLGKTTTARIFAAALLCEHRSTDGDACGLCQSCLQITGPRGEHPDVVELDAASNGGKDEIRDLAARAALAPLRGRWKVYIVDEAHGLTGPGGQAFLRLLEEPPAHCLFVLATTDPGKLPTALQGRCLYLEVLPPTRAEVLDNLRRVAAGEDWEVSDAVLAAVADASDPRLGLRGTVATLEKLAGPLADGADLGGSDLELYLGSPSGALMTRLADAIAAGDAAGALGALAAVTSGPGRGGVHRQLVEWARADLTRRATASQDLNTSLERLEVLVNAAPDPAALTVAVARAALVGAPAHPAPAPTSAPAETRPPVSAAGLTPAPIPAVPQVPQASAVPQGSAAPAPVPTPTPAADEQAPAPLAAKDPKVVALLNATSKVNARAAFVLSRCQVYATAAGLSVSVPPDQATKAAQCGLEEALRTVSATGAPVTLAS